MNKKLTDHYDKMWKSARLQFESGKCEMDSLIDDNEDQRRGITLLARLEDLLSAEISNFQRELKEVESTQYFQPITDLHLTILSIISCYAGFRLDQIVPEEYQRIIEACLPVPFTIRFEGITASPSGILIQGFPQNNTLDQLRDGLRIAFKNSNLQHSIDSRYKINTAHLTMMRFKKPLTNPEVFVKLLDKYRAHLFGTMEINHLNLVFNDWYQRTEKVQELATFELKQNSVLS